MNENQAHKWYLSTSAFGALFSPLPAAFHDAVGHGIVRADARTQSVDDAFTCRDFSRQSRLLNMEESQIESMREDSARFYNGFAEKTTEYSLGGHRMGVLSHQETRTDQLVNPAHWANEMNVTLRTITQALVLFHTADGAAKYAGNVHGGNPCTHPTLAKRVEQKAQELRVQGLENVCFHVMDPMKAVMCTCAVQNVYLHLVMSSVVDSEDVFVSIATKAIVHLYRQLVHYRSTDSTNLAEAPSVLPPDPDMCAYCDKENSTKLHACAQCNAFWYCSKDCQVKHWKMKGPFSHRRECKLMADPLVLPPAISLGRLVMIHSLTSAAGQRMNGKDAIVVTQPTDNGRLGVVLVDDVSVEEVERMKRGDVSWVPNNLQKAINFENLELVWTPSKV